MLVLRLVPVLHQYLGLVSFTLNQSVACHRTTCKLLSVLLGIFTELAGKVTEKVNDLHFKFSKLIIYNQLLGVQQLLADSL